MANEDNGYLDGFREDGTLEPFELPRQDWFDSNGRVYKDVLIENFNAIQDKLLQINGLTPFSTTPPDISTIVYPDTDLNSADNKIMNLRSFLTINNLVGYPLVCSFSGTKVKEVSYWNSNYEYVIKRDIGVSASKSSPYIYLNYVLGTIEASSSSQTPANCRFIGYYENGIIRHVDSVDFRDINLLYYLSKMDIETRDVEMKNSEWFRDQWAEKGWLIGNGTVGATDLDTRSGGNLGTVTFMRYGRKK